MTYYDKIKCPDSGAISAFIGVTRNNFENKIVTYLEYEFHKTMAIKQLFKIAQNAYKKFSLSKIFIIHRVGQVKVTEESILILCVGSHRKESIDSSSEVIEEVKKNVPIWKKEYYEGENNYIWKENLNSIHFN